jgi:Domain of unknown function (DUF4189)
MKRTCLQACVLTLGFVLFVVVLLPSLAVAEGALAIGLPNDVTKNGVALGWNANSATSAEATQKAMANCQNVQNSTPAARSLCAIVGSFHDQCVAGAENPKAGTPGVGWAVAADKNTAEQQALTMCKMKSPPAQQADCKVLTSGCDGSGK